MTYAEFKRLDIYKTATIIKICNENGTNFNNEISEKELNKMEVKAYYVNDKQLYLELGESISEFV